MARHSSSARTAALYAAAAAILVVLTLAGIWYARAPAPVAHPERESADEDAAFNAEPIAPLPRAVRLDPAKVALGAKLFHDTRLSHDDTVSCATCHQLDNAGIDGRATAVGIGGQVGGMNTPTVFNSRFNFRQFWDGRAADLEQQAGGPVHNPTEMASNWREVIGKLSQDRYYREIFARLYPDGITDGAIADAIATFERTLVTPDAPIDRFLRGDKSALTERQQQGYRLFKNLGCASCHQGVNIGGNFYSGLGIFGDFFGDRRKNDAADQGRFNATGNEADRHRFKVPSLRNITRTAPYFHDGSVRTLEEAIRLMAKYQLGQELTRDQVALLAEFLHALTGKYQGESL